MKYLNNTYRGFTLIELMVVITLLSIVTLMSYVPYAHHQKKLLLSQGTREISQSFSEARNLAIHGLNTGSWNLNVGLFFWSWATELVYYTSTWTLSLSHLHLADIYKIKPFPKWVQVDSINAIKTDFLFSYERISGSGTIEPLVWTDELDISLSYKWSSSPVLQKNIRYYTQSYIVDY